MRKLAIVVVGLMILGASALSGRVLLSLRRGPSPESTPRAESTPPAAEPTSAGVQGDLPWPYCLPEAVPPSPLPTSWPPLPPETGTGWRRTLDPTAMALVEVSSIIPKGPREGLTYPWDEAQVLVTAVLWQTEFPTSSTAQFFPIVEGTSMFVGERELWTEGRDALTTGGRLVIGVIDAWPDGAYQAGYALSAEPEAPTFLGRSPFAERDTGQFRMFLDWKGNPMRSVAPAELLAAWNAEMAAPPARYPRNGPISRSWSRFWDIVTGTRDFPMPGSREWWEKAPPLCRSLMDAPPGVLDGLPGGEVFIRVPDSWRRLLNGAVCLRISLGSTGGCIAFDMEPNWPYLWFDEVYAVPGEPVQINVSLERKDGLLSAVEEVVIGVIPFETFTETGSVLAELDDSFSPHSYEDVAAHPDAVSLATVRSISPEESDTILATMPQATARECTVQDPYC
jgi:hypothetical protein